MQGLITYAVVGQENRLLDYLDNLDPGLEISIAVRNAVGQITFEYNSDKRVPAASVIKIPILAELLLQVQTNEVRLSERYALMDEHKVGGSGELRDMPEGKTLTLEELAVEMIRVSDNTATNVLIERLGMARINQTLDSLGFEATRLNRVMMDFAAIDEGRQNYTSASEMSRFLSLLLTNKILTPELGNTAIEILGRCEDSTTIPRDLPADLIIAHKTGTLDYVRGDAGIILDEDPIILAIFVENFQSLDQAEQVIGDLARIVFDLERSKRE